MKTLIVDDEPLARIAIRSMLRAHPEIEIAGECESGAEAIAAIESTAPDLVFLDVQMPEIDGFGVLEALDGPLPKVVFVTAYDRYAVRAFEVHALDYLLKPFDSERFESTLQRALQQKRSERLLALLGQVRADHPQRWIIRSEGLVFPLPAAEIDWVEAQGNYVNLHAGRRRYLLREPLSALEDKLDPRKFRRIHRSTIVNLDSIREMRPCFHGDYDVVLRDGSVLRLSHRYKDNLREFALGGL